MAAIQYVAEKLYTDTEEENTDVEMKSSSVSEGSSGMLKMSPSARTLANPLSSSSSSSASDIGATGVHEDLHIKFAVTGTSNRPHHSGKKKVVRKHCAAVPAHLSVSHRVSLLTS